MTAAITDTKSPNASRAVRKLWKRVAERRVAGLTRASPVAGVERAAGEPFRPMEEAISILWS
jgi:hypothetical protein